MGFSLFRVVIPAPAHRRQAKRRHCRAQRVVNGAELGASPSSGAIHRLGKTLLAKTIDALLNGLGPVPRMTG
jgi:hypothetical protein